jgi:hypothetical protein
MFHNQVRKRLRIVELHYDKRVFPVRFHVRIHTTSFLPPSAFNAVRQIERALDNNCLAKHNVYCDMDRLAAPVFQRCSSASAHARGCCSSSLRMHNATLCNMLRLFADVAATDDVISRLR